MPITETCYACTRKPTGVEHVPPKAFFPERKDLPAGFDLRHQLITVPSCNRHNVAKAGDDEYLLFVIATSFETNPVAQHHYSTKLRRAILRRPAIKGLFQGLRHILVNGVPSGAYDVDAPRARRSLVLMGRAIFFHQFRKRWKGRLTVLAPSFLRLRAAASPEYAAGLAKAEATSLKMFQNEERFGANPQVFLYQVHEGRSQVTTVLRIVFYGRFSCYVYRQSAAASRRTLSDA